MAETSGFLTDLPQSAYLSLSMKRAISAAQQRSHRYVTLEHLLLSLLDDPNAIEILEGLRADLPAIRGSITETVNRNLTSLYTPGEFDLRASYKVERVLQAASDDADRLGCDEVDAAFILASVSRETDDPAGRILKQNGFAYSAAVTWLYANRGTSPASRTTRDAATAAPAAVLEPEPESAQAPAPVSTIEVPARTASDIAQETEPAHEADDDGPSAATREEEPLELDLELVEESEKQEPRRTVKQQTPPTQNIEEQSGAQRSRPVPGMRPTPTFPVRAGPDQPDAPSENHAGPAPDGVRSTLQKPVRPISDRPEVILGRSEERPPPIVVQRRAQPQLPPSSRLDEMRVRGGTAKSWANQPVPAPAPPPKAPEKKRGKKRNVAAETPAAAAERQKGRRQGRRPHEILIGRLVENIPRRMRAAVADRIEVRISREETQLLARRMEGRADLVRHEVMVTQTMSVALRAPDGGFTIEPLSPETQWIFDHPDSGETYGRWRWVVTPHEPGERRLQLIVAARSVGLSGHIGDSALPDQVITVRVRTNYWRSLGRGVKWIMAMIIGGLLTELAMHAMRTFGQ